MTERTRIDIAQIPTIELRILCATILDGVNRFYEDPENIKGFERWLKEQEGGEADGQKDGGKTAAGISEPCAAQGSGAIARCF